MANYRDLHKGDRVIVGESGLDDNEAFANHIGTICSEVSGPWLAIDFGEPIRDKRGNTYTYPMAGIHYGYCGYDREIELYVEYETPDKIPVSFSEFI